MKQSARIHVEIEPLSEAKRAKIERALFVALDAGHAAPAAPPPPRLRRPTVVVALGAMAAAAGLALLTRALLAPADARTAHIATTDGPSQITFGGATLELAPQSSALVQGDDEHGTSVVLDHGGITCDVTPRRGRPPFTVEAGDVRVRVVGTRFTVERGDTATRVYVDHGAVEVTARGAVTMLHDGERWPDAPSAPATATTAEIVAPPETAEDEAVPAPARTRPRHGRPAPPRAPATAPAAAPSTPQAHDGEEVPTQRSRFEQAARLELARPAEAEALYRKLASEGGPWAANALFALGRLSIDRNRKDEGRALLERYLAQYPRGLNAADARALLENLK